MRHKIHVISNNKKKRRFTEIPDQHRFIMIENWGSFRQAGKLTEQEYVLIAARHSV